MDPKKRRRIIAAAAVISVICAMFVTDFLRTKGFGLPPVFCIPSDHLSDGVSRDYYGFGYKIWKDTNPFDGRTEYKVTLWIIPKAFGI